MAQINRHIFIDYIHIHNILCVHSIVRWILNMYDIIKYDEVIYIPKCTSYSCSGHGQNVEMIENFKKFLLSCNGFPILEIYYVIIITCLLNHGNANFIYSLQGWKIKNQTI
jgi:hypothetical protein